MSHGQSECEIHEYCENAPWAGGVEFVSSGQRLRDVLKEIVDRYRIAEIILAENGEVRPWARVSVNGRSHQFVGGLDAELSDGDRIALIYPYTENF